MDETIKLEMTKEEVAQFQQVLDEYLNKIEKIREQMAQDQVEIEQYGSATQAIIDRMNRRAA